jgi:uncharacterized protein (TIGR00296 family)
MIAKKTQAALLALVRATIARKLGFSGELADEFAETLERDPFLREKRGVFVTLHKEGALRGCIGYIEPVAILAEAIPEMALAAAFRDPRFPPLFYGRVGQIDIENFYFEPAFPLPDPGRVGGGQARTGSQPGDGAGCLAPGAGGAG